VTDDDDDDDDDTDYLQQLQWRACNNLASYKMNHCERHSFEIC